MKENNKLSFTVSLTPSVAILIGSVIISLAILISNGALSWKGFGKEAQVITPGAQVQPTNVPVQPQVTLEKVKEVFSKSLIKFGDSNKKVIFIEVADPSCPYCQVAAGKNPKLNKDVGSRFTMVADGGTYVAPVPEMEKLVKEGKAAFAYLYTPGHGNGEMGTKALYCAMESNKFWEVSDLLMTAEGYDILNSKVQNDKTKSGEMANFLQQAIDPSVMKQCLDSGKYDGRLAEDQSLAASLNVRGTPGFYVNTTLYAGAYSFKDMESTVNSLLK